jgi:hypothetical protein
VPEWSRRMRFGSTQQATATWSCRGRLSLVGVPVAEFMRRNGERSTGFSPLLSGEFLPAYHEVQHLR